MTKERKILKISEIVDFLLALEEETDISKIGWFQESAVKILEEFGTQKDVDLFINKFLIGEELIFGLHLTSITGALLEKSSVQIRERVLSEYIKHGYRNYALFLIGLLNRSFTSDELLLLAKKVTFGNDKTEKEQKKFLEREAKKYGEKFVIEIKEIIAQQKESWNDCDF
jgi:hypothetical protein